MELRHLRYFVMVAREQSFTRAAEKLHIAQPPLSRQIQQLEEELGVALIQRSSRPAFLTEAGRLLYEQASPGAGPRGRDPGHDAPAPGGAPWALRRGLCRLNALWQAP